MLNDLGKFQMKKITVEECKKVTVKQLGSLVIANASRLEIDRQTIPLTQTNCNYGGQRGWFVCPTCNARVGRLYKPPMDISFECRKCKDLVYELTIYRKTKKEVYLKNLHLLAKS